MTRKYLTVRREKTRQLAAREAAARCAFCKKALTASAVTRWDDSKRYCDSGCLEIALEMEARR